MGQASINPSFASRARERPARQASSRLAVWSVGPELLGGCYQLGAVLTHYGRTAPGRSVPLSKMHFRQFSPLGKCLDGVSLSAKMAAALLDWNVELSPTCQSKRLILPAKSKAETMNEFLKFYSLKL